MSQDMEQLYSEELRLKTFQDHGWRLTHLKPETLAKCGFFYLGDGDRVQCPFCGIVIFNWQCGDEPIFEHRIHSGKCPFINGQDVGNIFIDIDPRETYGLLTPGQDVCGFSHLNITESIIETNSEPSHGPGIVFKAPKSTEFITYESRLASFVDWPITKIISPAQLAESGFYFKGPVISFDRDYQDYVTCFHCGIGLCQWTKEDDPWLEHQKFNPECSFLHLVSRQPTDETPSTATQPFIPYTWLPQPEQEDLCCNVCLDFQMGATFYPCLHSSCVLCAASLSSCPLCRSNIERVIKIKYESKNLEGEEKLFPLIKQLAQLFD